MRSAYAALALSPSIFYCQSGLRADWDLEGRNRCTHVASSEHILCCIRKAVQQESIAGQGPTTLINMQQLFSNQTFLNQLFQESHSENGPEFVPFRPTGKLADLPVNCKLADHPNLKRFMSSRHVGSSRIDI